MQQNSKISAISYYVPDGKLTQQELGERFGHEQMNRVSDSSGILERRVSRNGECASDLAFIAAKTLFEEGQIDPRSIDLVVFATQTPDYLLPTTACILQDRLGIPQNAAAFDVNLGCSQYVYSLSIAHSMIVAGLAKRALVLTGDTVTKILNPQDRSVIPLFGDGGTATILDLTNSEEGFKGFELGSDGSGHPYLIWPASGLRIRRTPETAIEKTDDLGGVRSLNDMYMDGKAIFLFTLKVVPHLVSRLLARSNETVETVDWFIFHQASELIVESAAKKLKIPREKLHYKLHDVGNSGGSTVAITLTDALLAGKIKAGQKVVLCAFGVGLSWAATLIRWPDASVGAFTRSQFGNSPPRPKNQDYL